MRAIASATTFFGPYIIQSAHRARVLTDSTPCVRACAKLGRGSFSASPCVTAMLTAASRFHVDIRQLAGSSNLHSDFLSRNTPECTTPTCQVCSFNSECDTAAVQAISVKDVIDGKVRVPYSSQSAWRSVQQECSDVRRAIGHLKQGTRPSKKVTNARDVKRYLQSALVASDGILIVKAQQPLVGAPRELIVVPRDAVHGLLTALHLQLDHPKPSQLKLVFQRFYFALDADKVVTEVSEGCHQCVSFKKVPKALVEQSTGPPPPAVGVRFAADVMKRECQLILVVREYVSSYTYTLLLKDERKESLRDGLLQLFIGITPLDGPLSVIRTDSASGFKPLAQLVGDELLQRHNLCVELGEAKNISKNPVAERAVQEVEEELLRADPTGKPVSEVSLAVVTARLNSRIRSRGFAAREMLFHRDMFSSDQLELKDRDLIATKHEQKLANHEPSAKSKAPFASVRGEPCVIVGDVVYLVKDLGKHAARDRYLVGRVEAPWCYIRKLTDGGQLRDAFYKVKLRDVLKVPATQPIVPVRTGGDDSDDEFLLEGVVGGVARPERDTEEYAQAGADAVAESEEGSVAPLPAVTEVLLQDDDVKAPAGGATRGRSWG